MTDPDQPRGPLQETPPVAESYAAATAELDGILAAIERDDLDVDHLAAQVGRAAELIRFCRERIRTAGAEVEQIVASIGEAGPGSGPGVDEGE